MRPCPRARLSGLRLAELVDAVSASLDAESAENWERLLVCSWLLAELLQACPAEDQAAARLVLERELATAH